MFLPYIQMSLLLGCIAQPWISSAKTVNTKKCCDSCRYLFESCCWLTAVSDGQSTIEISSIVRNRPTLHPWDVCFWMVTVSKIEIASPILRNHPLRNLFLKGWIGSQVAPFPLHDANVKAPILHMATVRWYEPQRWEDGWGLVQDISKVNEVTLYLLN